MSRVYAIGIDTGGELCFEQGHKGLYPDLFTAMVKVQGRMESAGHEVSEIYYFDSETLSEIFHGRLEVE